MATNLERPMIEKLAYLTCKWQICYAWSEVILRRGKGVKLLGTCVEATFTYLVEVGKIWSMESHDDLC